jgi:DNA-binding SARP family transcriptional activator
VARGTQHRKRRPQANAGVSAQPKAKSKKPKHESWEDQLFFSRLRVHAKWVFLLLAIVFAFSFVLFGVGTGSSGIGDIFSNLFNGSSSSGPSASSLQKKVREDPKDAAAWRDLATALEQKDETEQAIAALTRYTALKPKDEDALQELGGLYLRRADDFAQQYVEAQNRAQALAPGESFKPATPSPFAQAFQDPLTNAITQSTSKITTDAYSKYVAIQGKAVVVYKRLAALNPKDATNQYRLAQVAQAAGKTPEAIAAYKAFLKLAPNDALAPAAKKALKQLTAPPTAAASTG